MRGWSARADLTQPLKPPSPGSRWLQPLQGVGVLDAQPLCLKRTTAGHGFPLRRFWSALGSDSALCLQARLEVHRFGITGYGKGKERVLERERAVMLGAQVRGRAACCPQTGHGKPGQGTVGHVCKMKITMCVPFLSFQPPKKSYVNYKVLQEQIKEKQAAKAGEKRMVGVMASSSLKLEQTDGCSLSQWSAGPGCLERSRVPMYDPDLSTYSGQPHFTVPAKSSGACARTVGLR